MKRTHGIFLIGILISTFAVVDTPAQEDCTDYEAYLHLANATNLNQGSIYLSAEDFTIAGRYGYLAGVNRGLTVLDMIDPDNPEIVGFLDTYARGLRVVIEGSYALLGGEYALTIVDISNPASPTTVGAIAMPSGVREIVPFGDTLYLAGSGSTPSHLAVVDWSDPTAPNVVNEIPDMNGIMQREDDRLFVIHGSDLQVFDLADPLAPALIGTVPLASNFAYIYDFEISDNIVYLVGGPVHFGILDITDLSAPAWLGTVDDPPYSGFDYSGIALAGNFAYISGSYSPLMAYDISDFSHPVLTGSSWSPPRANKLPVVLDGGYAYTVNGGQVSTFRLGNSHQAAALGRIDLSDRPSALVSLGEFPDMCLVGAGTMLKVIDHANPLAPETLASLDIGGSIQEMALSRNTAYIAAQEAGLKIVDVTAPDLPREIGSLEFVDAAADVIVDGYWAFVSLDEPLLEVVDIHDPAHPVAVSELVLSSFGWRPQLALSEHYLYCATGDLYDNLQVVDIQDPAHPVILNTSGYPGGYGLSDAVIIESYLYISDESLLVFDLSTPETPVLVNEVLEREISHLDRDGDMLYMSEQLGGLKILDVLEPESPRVVGDLFHVGNDFPSVAVSGDHILLACQDSVTILPRQCSDIVPTFLQQFQALDRGDAVEITWTVTAPAVVDGFRVIATQGGIRRMVPLTDLGPQTYQARDDLVDRRSGAAVTYDLEFVDEGGVWRLLDSQTLHLLPISGRTRITGTSPNPFNPQLEIRFVVMAAGKVTVKVHDLSGRFIATLADAEYEPGPQQVVWSGRDSRNRPLPSGTYLVRLESTETAESRKISLVR